jgi:hypothetical protein
VRRADSLERPAQADGHFLMKRVVFPLTTILLSLLVVGLVLEVGVRVAGHSPANASPFRAFNEYDPLLGHIGKKRHAAYFRTPEFDTYVVHDSRGFRKQEHLHEKGDALPAIHVFGDSFTWGWGVGQGEVFTDQLNRLLPGYRVMNYGISAVGTVVEHVLFSSMVKPDLRQGDIVLVMVFNNDFTDNINPSQVHAEIVGDKVALVNTARRFASPVQDFFAQHCHLYSYIAHKIALYRLSRRAKKGGDEAPSQRIGVEDPRYIVMKHYLNLFWRDCEEKGTRFVAVYIPGQSELGETSQHKPNKLANERMYHGAFEAIAGSVNCETLDLLPSFEAYKKQVQSRLTFPNDEHWTRTGHAAAAQAIHKYVLAHQ